MITISIDFNAQAPIDKFRNLNDTQNDAVFICTAKTENVFVIHNTLVTCACANNNQNYCRLETKNKTKSFLDPLAKYLPPR